MPLTSKLNDLVCCVNESKAFRVLKGFERHIVRNFNIEGFETRPSSSSGLWCCLPLPMILVLYSLQYKVSLLYSIVTCISVGFLFYCLLFIVFLSVSCLVLKEKIYGGCGASSMVSAVLLYTLLDQSLMFSLTISMLAIQMYGWLLKTSLTIFPKTFTIGEAILVTQGIVLFCIMMLLRLIYRDIGDTTDKEMEFVYSINLTALSSVAIIVTALSIIDKSHKTIHGLCYLVGITGTFALVMLHVLIGVDCMVRIPSYLLLDMKKLQLFLFWVFLTGLAVAAVMMRTSVKVKATTVTRKVFHVLISLVFLSGILIDLHLMTLAAGCGLGLIILIEALRKADIETVTPALQQAFKVFSDEKDAGYFAMTPIYLYVGVACPLLLVPVHPSCELELMSGILSIGIGDTAASWFGSNYGFNKFTDSNKSYEGTVFNVLSQITTVYLLDVFGLLNLQNAVLRTCLAAFITGWVEAKTDQIDNLILPIFSIFSYQITSFVLPH